MTGWFVVALLPSITLMLPSAAQMLGVELVQFWLGHACPAAGETATAKKATVVNTAKNEETTFRTSLERRLPIIGQCLSQANLLFRIEL